MPRKAKDEEKIEINSETKPKKTSSKKSVAKTTTSKKGAPKSTEKKSTSSKKSSEVKKDVKKKKEPVKKVADRPVKKTVTKSSKKATETKVKTPSNKKADVKKETTKKTTAKKISKDSPVKEESKTRKTKESVSKSASKTSKSSEKRTAKKLETKVTKKVEKKEIKPVKSKATKVTKKSETTKKKSTTSKSKKEKLVITPADKNILEYYDLPFRYNETIVKLLAQTPKRLFIYWDISDQDRQNLIANFGDEFFNNTVPVLIIHNETTNNSFEIEINDFANCWYLDITDTSMKYKIELGRRSRKSDYYIPNNYIYLSSSNEIESPNDHILFEKLSNTVYFRNVKNNTTYPKNIANMNFMNRIGKIYSIYDYYKKLYADMYIDEDFLNNPSSGNPTSTFK